MSIALHADPIPLHVDETGTIRVGQSRVTLDVVLGYWQAGMTADDIARGLDTLTKADVHGALAYYFRHQDEIDEYLRRRDEEAESLRREIESKDVAHRAQLKSRLNANRTNGSGHAATAD
jgi:uncharacterized protein (DUF433 family)